MYRLNMLGNSLGLARSPLCNLALMAGVLMVGGVLQAIPGDEHENIKVILTFSAILTFG